MNLVKPTHPNNAPLTIGGFNQEQTELIKNHLMARGKDAPPPTNDDLALYGTVCQRLGLDPFSKQIYAIQRKGKWTYQISIDGLRAIADRSGQYAGSDEPLFDEGLTEWECISKNRNQPNIAKVTVWKMVQGQRCPFVGIAKWSESAQSFYDTKSNQKQLSETWATMPFSMLAKCAESQSLRKAFPQVMQSETQIEQIEDDSWRIDGYQWGVSQGVSPTVANQIMAIASSPENLNQRMKSAIPITVQSS